MAEDPSLVATTAAVARPATGADGRLLLITATAKDAALAQSVLAAAGVTVDVCQRFETLLGKLKVGAAAVMVAEEVLSAPHSMSLATIVAEQPTWSDLPVLVLARPGADSEDVGDAVRSFGNVTVLERPLRIATLLSAVRTAMRARERQYQIRGHLAERVRTEAILRQSDQRKDEFLATLGHELRNPLAPLSSALQLLMTDSQQDRSVVAVMRRQLGHLTRLVDDLLEVSRITRGLIEVRREPIDLAFVLHSAVESSRPAIDAGGHTLEIEWPVLPITIDGDAVRLTQVFTNLLANAAKYTNTGGRIWLSARRERDRAVVSVRDTGIGIPGGQLEAVFDMFTQVDRSSRRSQGGLGIGLTLARSLVGMHGGRIEARSAGAGLGSEFVVELPAAALPQLNVPRHGGAAALPPRRILVVDDNADAAEMLGILLETFGGVVAVRHSGREALEAFESFRPDAVLLDIGMPDMDGYEVARRIRALAGARVLLLALTGWGQEHDQQRSRDAGFDRHMIKPPDIDLLREVLVSDWATRQHA